MESIVSAFHIEWSSIISQMVNFGVVFAVLYIFAIKPLQTLMEERTGRISRGVEDAKANAEILERTQREYEDALKKAREDANNIFQQGKKEAEAKRAAMLEEASKEVSSMIEGGKRSLAREKSKMVDEARSEIVALAAIATEKLIKEKVDLKDL